MMASISLQTKEMAVIDCKISTSTEISGALFGLFDFDLVSGFILLSEGRGRDGFGEGDLPPV